MAANNSALVTTGKAASTGAVFAAPTGTTLPTDATTARDEAFVALGYVGEDGLTNAIETDTEDIKAWGGDTVATVRTSRSETFSWTFIQSLDPDVLKEVFGQSNVTGTASTALTVKHNSVPLGRRSYVFEMLMTGDRRKRIVVPSGEITEVGETTYVDGEAVGYEVTLTCFPDEAGNTAYEYISATAAG